MNMSSVHRKLNDIDSEPYMIITINIPVPINDLILELEKEKLFNSRSEFIRMAINDFIIRMFETWEKISDIPAWKKALEKRIIRKQENPNGHLKDDIKFDKEKVNFKERYHWI